jgi:Leucine-rich repeat (LRR) protein
MSGEIPASVSNLTKLTRVYLQNNQFSGNIPEGFGNAPDMYQIFLNDNQFEGQIPASLGGLNALVSFDVSNNNLSGTLPTELGNQSSILLFNIANNDFSGSLPDWSGITDPENAAFNLTNNYFDFSDLEPFVNNGVNYSSILYSPQRTLDQEDDIQTPPGVDIQLDIDDADINRNSDDTAMNNEYQWYKDNVAISGANANTYTIVNAQTTDSGIYFCEITNTTLPGLVIVRADINVLVDDNLSTTDFEYNNFKIYPNPVNNWLSIKTNTITHAKVQVFDVHGKLVIERPLTSEITALDVERLSSGMYLISVSTNDKQTTKRFIKQ